MNQYKSTAGAAALVALAELYRGIATLDVIDTLQLSRSGQIPAAAVRDRAALAEANGHFASASDALSRAIEVCAGFRRPAEQVGQSRADCDAAAFERLRGAVDRLRGASGETLPALTDIQSALTAATEVARAWSDSALALRGTAGHYSASADAPP